MARSALLASASVMNRRPVLRMRVWSAQHRCSAIWMLGMLWGAAGASGSAGTNRAGSIR